MNKTWKKFVAWLNRPGLESTCGDCGETYGHFGPDGPRHKCDVKK